MRAFALALLLTSCAADTAPSGSGVFVGTLDEGRVFAASVWQPDRVLIYTCGVDATLPESTAWLIGNTNSGTVEADDGPFSVVATREGERVQGSFVGMDGAQDLELQEIASLEDAGFFALIDGGCRTALIAFKEAGTLRFQGAHFCEALGPFFQVTPVLPPEVLGDELRVRFDDGTGEQELMLPRLTGI